MGKEILRLTLEIIHLIFFDFIIIDECHLGGANDEGNWRGILEYFSPAVQLGLTATPRRKGNGDTYDDYVYTPDDELIEGEVEQGKRYTEDDFNRVIEIKAREMYRVRLFIHGRH